MYNYKPKDSPFSSKGHCYRVHFPQEWGIPPRPYVDYIPEYWEGKKRVLLPGLRYLPDVQIREALSVRAAMLHSKLADKRIATPFTTAQYQKTLPQSSALRKGYDPPPKPSAYRLKKESSRLHEMKMLPHGLAEPDVSLRIPMALQGYTKACLMRKCQIDSAALMEIMREQSRNDLIESMAEEIFNSIFEETSRHIYKQLVLQRAKEIALQILTAAKYKPMSETRLQQDDLQSSTPGPDRSDEEKM